MIDRPARLRAAGYNVLNLEAADVEIDLWSDIPERPSKLLAIEDGEPDLQALATAVYGPARYVATAKGRAAEFALVAALELKEPTVLTHGMFRSTERSLEGVGARIERLPVDPNADGRCDVDLDALDRRLQAGKVDLVYLEPCNNALLGQPLSVAHVEAVSARCHAHGARLAIDAARIMTSVAALTPDAAAVLPEVHRMLSFADAFTVSCAKELLVPHGALVGLRDLLSQRRAHTYAFSQGTLLEPLRARETVGAGLRYVAAHPEVVVSRQRQVAELVRRLAAADVPVHPVAGHAAYVKVDSLGGTVAARARGLEALLYLRSGVRGVIWPYSILKTQLMRLPVPVACYDDATLARAADAVRDMFARADEAPSLKPSPTSDHLYDVYMKYEPA